MWRMFSFISHASLVFAGVVRHTLKSSYASPHWPLIERQYLKQHPNCEACGGTWFLQVHHVEPYQSDPYKELDTDNLIGLCEGRLCHRLLGHGGDYMMFNPDVRDHVWLVAENPATRKEVLALAKKARLPLHRKSLRGKEADYEDSNP